jgi:hypothetical protein
MTKPRWNRKLVRPLHTRDGQTISTLAEARDFALSLPAKSAATNGAWPLGLDSPSPTPEKSEATYIFAHG